MWGYHSLETLIVALPLEMEMAEESEMTEGVKIASDTTASTKTASSGDSDTQGRTGKPRAAAVPRPYPRRTLEDALRIPNAIKDKNGGNPWAPTQVAKAVDMGMSSGFFYLTSAARDFGLTNGTREATEISLTDLGRRAVYPSSSDEKLKALREAFFSVEIFKKVVNHYHGSKLPEEPYLSNTLTTTFGLDASIVSEFVDLFAKNTRFVGIGTDWDGATDESNHAKASGLVDGTDVRRVGSPSKKVDTGLRCFIAMPFSEHNDERPVGFFQEVLDSLLIPAITEAGFEAITAKRQGSDIIQSTIVNELLDADLVVVDLTEHNPNVLFELGMRMHADKPVALIRAKGTGAIFDVDNLLRVEEYSPNLWPSTVKRDLESLRDHVRAAWENRDTSQTFMQILQRRS